MTIGVVSFGGEVAVTVNRKSHTVWISDEGMVIVRTAYPQPDVDYYNGHVKIIGVDDLDAVY